MHSRNRVLASTTFGLAALTLTASFTGCGLLETSKPRQELQNIENAKVGTDAYVPATLMIGDQPATLFTSTDNRIAFRMGESTRLLDEGMEVKGGNRVGLKQNGDHLYAYWWSHEKAKAIYFTSSQDGGKTFAPVQIVNDNSGVLAPFSIMTGKDGVVAMTYMDEREPKYEVFFNRSTDHGKTWPRPDQRLDNKPASGDSMAMFPRTIQTDSAWVTVWTNTIESMGQKSHQVLARRSLDQGLTWSEETLIYQDKNVLTSMEVSGQGHAMVVAFDIKGHGLGALVTKDDGATWKSVGFLENGQTTVNSGIDIQVNGNLAHLVWSEQSAKTPKASVMAATIDIAQGAWKGTGKRIDAKPFYNTRTVFPHVITTQEGHVVAAWMDFRDIRPNIYMSASFDNGASWSAPQPLGEPGKLAHGLPRLYPSGKDILLAYQTYPGDRQNEGHYIVERIELDPPKGIKGMAKPQSMSEEKRKEMLQSRANELWKLRVEGKFEETYPFHDPAYKAATSLDHFRMRIGNIKYNNAVMQQIVEIQENVAKVKFTVNYSVNSVPVNGRIINIPPHDTEVTTTWVWVHDNWYLMFEPAVGKPYLKY
ncbi:MAG: sialidase family protein [Pseudomonadota bacterium]